MEAPKVPTPTQRILMYFKRCAYSMSQRPISSQDKAAYAVCIRRQALRAIEQFRAIDKEVDEEKILKALKYFDIN